jgi:hypothetical protein
MKRFYRIVSLLGVNMLLAACSTPPWVSLNSLNLYTISNTTGKKPDTQLSLAVANPEITIVSSLGNTTNNVLAERLKYDAEKISCNIGSQLNSALLAKGFTVTEVFPSLNHMTFSEKRNSSAVITARIRIVLTEDSKTTFQENWPLSVSGDIIASATAKLVAIEPLSKELIWIKDIPISDLTYPFNISGNAPQGTKTSVPPGFGDFAGTVDKILTEVNETVLLSAQKYIDHDEFLRLNDDITKLKGIKRY